MKRILVIALLLCSLSAYVNAARTIKFSQSSNSELKKYLGPKGELTLCDSTTPYPHLPGFGQRILQFKKDYAANHTYGCPGGVQIWGGYVDAMHNTFFLTNFSKSSVIYNCQYLKTIKLCEVGQNCGPEEGGVICYDKNKKDRPGASKSGEYAATLQKKVKSHEYDGEAWDILNRVEHLLMFIDSLPSKEQNSSDVKQMVKYLIRLGYNLKSGMGAHNQTTYGDKFDWYRLGKSPLQGYVSEVRAEQMKAGKSVELGYAGNNTKLSIKGTQDVTYAHTKDGNIVVTSKGTLYLNCTWKVTPKNGKAQITVSGNTVKSTDRGSSGKLTETEQTQCKGTSSQNGGQTNNSTSKPTQPQETYDQKSGKLVPGNGDTQKISQGSFIKRGAVYQSSYSVAIENCTKMVDPDGGIVSIQASDGKVLQGTPRGMTATERQDCINGAYKGSLNQKRDMLPEQVKDPTFEKLGEKLGSCTRTSATADKKVYHCTKIKIFNKKIKVTPQNGKSEIEFYKKGGFAVTQGTVEMLFDDVNNIVPPQKPQEKEKAKKKLPKGFKLFSNQCVDKGELIEDAGGGINWETSCPVEFETQGKHVRISPDWEKNPPVKLFIDPDGEYTLFNGIEEIISQPATPADSNKPEVKAEQNNSEKKDKPGDNAEEKSTNPDPKTDPEKPGGVADGQSTTGSADGTNDPNALTGDGNGGGIPVPDTLSNRVKQFFVGWTQGGKKISYVISPFKRDLEEEERQMQAAVNGEGQYE